MTKNEISFLISDASSEIADLIGLSRSRKFEISQILKKHFGEKLKSKQKYVWLDPSHKGFSDSWDEESMLEISITTTEELIEDGKKNGWKLINYECLTNEDFEFSSNFKFR